MSTTHTGSTTASKEAMMKKHTPGPWEVSGGDGIWAVSPWNARFRLATVTKPSPMNGIDWEANARLIAAAPELLEALRSLTHAVEKRNESAMTMHAGYARSILEKASGEKEMAV